MAMIVFMGMDKAMLLACYGHAISVIINMVMEMSWPWACHGHGQSRGQNHDFCQTYSKGYIFGKVMVLSEIKILDKVMKFSRS